MREYSSDCGQFVCLGEDWLIYLFYTLVCALVLTFFSLIWGGAKFWNLYHETRPSLMEKKKLYLAVSLVSIIVGYLLLEALPWLLDYSCSNNLEDFVSICTKR